MMERLCEHLRLAYALGAKQSPNLGIASYAPLSFAGTRDDVKF